MTDADGNAMRNFEKLRGDLLNQNTIAFDNLCKAYLCDWLLNGDNNKRVNTVLLYKGTRDGDRANAFHQKCDRRGATLTLVKSTTNFHFGGFTPTQWENLKTFRDTPGSFLFSLDKKLKYPPKNPAVPIYAVFDKSLYGPTFGGGYDLYIADGCMNNENSLSCPSSYDIKDSFSGSTKFKVSEIEVYQVIFE